MWFCFNLISSHFMKIWFYFIKKWFHSDFISFHFMKNWFHFMKMWFHSDFISFHFIKTWFCFDSDLKLKWDEIFWFWLSNIDYTIQKQQKILSSKKSDDKWDTENCLTFCCSLTQFMLSLVLLILIWCHSDQTWHFTFIILAFITSQSSETI